MCLDITQWLCLAIVFMQYYVLYLQIVTFFLYHKKLFLLLIVKIHY